MARAPIESGRTAAPRMANPLDVVASSAPAKKAPAKKAPTKQPAPRSAQPASRSRPTPPPANGQMTVDSFLAALRQHESGSDYTSRSSSSSASGAYQYIDSTWNHYGGYAHAWQAPPAVQDARARADVEANYRKYGGDWRKVAAAHFAGSGWVDKHPDLGTWDQNPVPGSNNPTVSQYVASVFRNAGVATDASGHTIAPTTTGGAMTAAPTATGGINGASDAYGLPPNATDAQVKDFIGANYGYLVGFLHDSELGPILLQAAREGWDSARLAGRLTQTNYWKKTSASARTWDAQTQTDNATQHQTVVNKQAEYAAEAKRLGYDIDPLKLHDMTVTALRLGWSTDQVDAAIRAQGKLNTGIAKAGSAQLKQTAAQYLVPVSDQTLAKWTADIAANKVTTDDFTTYLKEQAKSLFPGMSAAIDRGITPSTYVDPYRQYAAQILEVNPDSIDFLHDPKYTKALFNVDPKTGERTQMSLASWQTYLRTLPEYSKTANAVDQAAQFATNLIRTFGRLA